ncbi:hypothetical protein [Massilia soli]|uniref:Uncharacterized protein n=1 Tax=Massilia soli TaxID=2792854 RepID=A0ABS7SRK6_9BURK|nr:hypothetical protein [Massilia soli]MBZ2208581.1 hypothetical protein [Massilia soli]
MNNTTTENLNATSGSIVVYQRILPGKRPAKVEVIRAVYKTCKGPDGKAFGRTNNTVLLRVESGKAVLSVEELTVLVTRGLDDKQLAHVKQRLSELAGPARTRTQEMDIMDAKKELKSMVSLSDSGPYLAREMRAMLVGALHEIEERTDAGDSPAELDGRAPTDKLKDTFARINQACSEAQRLYKILPKGELPDDLTLEYQLTWYSYPDMLSTLRNRKCLSRPAGWTGLRAQVFDRRVFRSGDPVSEERPASYNP